ncbi:MAG: NAD-dependent succinate-semialdehyde dehydrogenase [Armatimonadota bacterium]|nr:NAD-dependent succinate-semialdehyde dehydrogenase [Armatimonadota bacterium]MDR7563423.1 NAD-dependent succinate-semialdehyde dehydrogenase [Armatimonadota bacterium]MDR7568883.1 NAD-dependent succinate-semialdehyde dehydrogenase [Armatimonadota bacterium]
MEHVDLLIDGAWVEGREKLSVLNPADEEVVGTASVATQAEVDAAVEAAERAFRAWSRTAPAHRAALLRRAAQLVRERLDRLARLLTLEQGKPLKDARGEVQASAEALEYYAEEARRILGRIIPTDVPNRRSLVVHQPVGPVAAIGPWNYPILLLAWKVAPALAAGCTVVAKPPSRTPLAVSRFLACLVEAGAPHGVVNTVIGPGSTVGAYLVRHPGIRKIAFTGETQTGKEILRMAAEGMKRVSLELGGHCPLLVFPDADLEAAARGAAYRAFRNMGQVCNAVNRIYVHHQVYEPFVERFVDYTRRLRIGPGLEDPDLGPMTTREGLEKTAAHIEDARARGARVAYGGHRPEGFPKGYFFTPTVLVDVDHSMKVMQEETFGPVAPIMPFGDLEEALRLANDTPYGLVAYAYTRELRTAFLVAEGLEAGTVGVNNVVGGEVPFPYGGWKESGFGMELSHEGLEEYLLTKHIRIDLL